MKYEKLDEKGLRLYCPKCKSKLPRPEGATKQNTCKKCKKIIKLSPMDDIPYSDTGISVYKSQEDIVELLESVGLKECTWSVTTIDNMKGYRLSATFDDGSEFLKEFPIPSLDNERHNKQLMRVFYHFVKAFTTSYRLGIMSKAEAMLGLLKVGNSNLGRQIENGNVNLLGEIQQKLLED